jgi:hypothetical protein
MRLCIAVIRFSNSTLYSDREMLPLVGIGGLPLIWAKRLFRSRVSGGTFE